MGQTSTASSYSTTTYTHSLKNRSSGKIENYFIYHDEPITVTEGGNTYYYLTNSQYSVHGLVDSSGALVEESRYTPYGTQTVISDDANVKNLYTYTGRRSDPESGLMYYRARYYSPEMGRFVSRDPLSYADGVNLYVYLSSNPMFWLDPSGEVKIRQNDVLDAKLGEKKIGDATVKTYEKVSSPLRRGARLVVNTIIGVEPKICYTSVFRWRQRFTMKDGKGTIQKWKGKDANRLLDPEPNDDEKDWYYTNAEWQSHESTAGRSSNFDDEPMLALSRIKKGTKKIVNTFELELVMVDDLNVKSGGTVVLKIEWGFEYTKTTHNLTERPETP